MPLASLTCGDLRKMGSGVTGLTVTQLDITDACFSSCYETLGTQTGWSSAQKTQLATTAKRVGPGGEGILSTKLGINCETD